MKSETLLGVATIGAGVASIAVGMTLFEGRERDHNRNKAVCEALAQGIEVTRKKMPPSLFSNHNSVYFPGETLGSQIRKCNDIGVEVQRAQAAKAIKATFMEGEEDVPVRLIRNVLREEQK